MGNIKLTLQMRTKQRSFVRPFFDGFLLDCVYHNQQHTPIFRPSNQMVSDCSECSQTFLTQVHRCAALCTTPSIVRILSLENTTPPIQVKPPSPVTLSKVTRQSENACVQNPSYRLKRRSNTRHPTVLPSLSSSPPTSHSASRHRVQP